LAAFGGSLSALIDFSGGYLRLRSIVVLGVSLIKYKHTQDRYKYLKELQYFFSHMPKYVPNNTHLLLLLVGSDAF